MADRYDGPERRTYGWHLRKEINVGHLLTTVTLLIALVVTWTQFNVRMALLEDRIVRQTTIDAKQDETSREAFARVDARLASVDSKLDKLLEWQIKRYQLNRDAN